MCLCMSVVQLKFILLLLTVFITFVRVYDMFGLLYFIQAPVYDYSQIRTGSE
jgi:hypothetical protein